MKVKKVDETVIRMAPWEVDNLIEEIGRVISKHQHITNEIFPLALHDFKEKLEASK